MQFDLSTKEAIGLAITLVGAFWGLAKMLLAQTQRQISTQFEQISVHLKKQEEVERRLEREVMELKAELPREYVRREDYIRGQSTLEAKLDALAGKVDHWQYRTHGDNT